MLTQFNRYASGFVDRRCSGLQTFLRRSTAHPVLSGNNDFVAFLTLPRTVSWFPFHLHYLRLPKGLLPTLGTKTRCVILASSNPFSTHLWLLWWLMLLALKIIFVWLC